MDETRNAVNPGCGRHVVRAGYRLVGAAFEECFDVAIAVSNQSADAKETRPSLLAAPFAQCRFRAFEYVGNLGLGKSLQTSSSVF
jgi:hypothetical protein